MLDRDSEQDDRSRSRRTLWVPPGKGRQVRRLHGESTSVLAGAADTEGAYAIRDNVIPPRFTGVPLHRHRDAEEAFFVLDGTLSVVADGDRIELPPDAFLLVPRGLPHSLANLGDQPVRWLTLISPGQHSEWIYAEEALIADGAGAIDAEALKRVHDQFGLEILGPAPEWPT